MGSGNSSPSSTEGSPHSADCFLTDALSCLSDAAGTNNAKVSASLEALHSDLRHQSAKNLSAVVSKALDLALEKGAVLGVHTARLLGAVRKMLHHIPPPALTPLRTKYEVLAQLPSTAPPLAAFPIAHELHLGTAALSYLSDPNAKDTHPYAIVFRIETLTNSINTEGPAAGTGIFALCDMQLDWAQLVTLIEGLAVLAKNDSRHAASCLYAERGIVTLALSKGSGPNAAIVRCHAMLTLLRLLVCPLARRVAQQIEDAVLLVYLTEPHPYIECIAADDVHTAQLGQAVRGAAARNNTVPHAVAKYREDVAKHITNPETPRTVLEEKYSSLCTVMQRTSTAALGLPSEPFKPLREVLSDVCKALGKPMPFVAPQAVLVPAKNQEAGAGTMKQTVEEFLEGVDAWQRRKAHGYDVDRGFDTVWVRAKGFDWNVCAKGLSEDAQRSVFVGVAEGPEELLLIHFMNTAEKIATYTGGVPPAVWGLGLTAAELRDVAGEVANGAVPEVIHRIPSSEAEWYAEARWVLQGGALCGVEVLLKMTQDAQPVRTVVMFKYAGSRLELVSTDTGKPALYRSGTVHTLPEDAERVAGSHVAVSMKEVEVRNPDGVQGSGGSKLKLKFVGQASARNAGVAAKGVVHQSVVSPKVVLTNPTKSTIAVTKFTMDFTTASGHAPFKGPKGVNATLAVPKRDAHRRVSVQECPEMDTFTIGEHETMELHVVGKQELQGIPYMGFPWVNMLHHSFLEAAGGTGKVQCRVSFTDDSGKVAKGVFECGNPSLEKSIATWEEAVTERGDEGLTPDCKCLIWISVDHPVTLRRVYLIVSQDATPECWVSRLAADSRSPPSSYQLHYPSSLARLGYQARKEGKTEMPLEKSDELSLTALCDPKQGFVYGLKAEVLIKHPLTGEVLTHVTKSALLDYSVMKDV